MAKCSRQIKEGQLIKNITNYWDKLQQKQYFK